MRKKTFLLLFPFFLLALATNAQQVVIPLEQIEDRFVQQATILPSEKVYLKTDKSRYVGGEDIWIRAFLADGTFHLPNALSHLLYVELCDPGDRVINRVLLRMQDSLIWGNIHLRDTITPGRYTLKAYTKWMQNFDPEFHFSKPIDIFNGSTGVNTQTTYIKEGDDATVRLDFIDNNGLPYSETKLLFDYYRNDKLIRSREYRTDKEGTVLVPFTLSDSVSRLEYSFLKEFPFKFQSTLNIPRLDDDFDISFHPEGGNLLLGVEQRIAFKAVDANGNSLPVTGRVLSPKKETLTSFNTQHRGMGTFLFTATHDVEYAVEVTNNRGVSKTFFLPKPNRAGYALAIDTTDNQIQLSANCAHFTQRQDSLRLLFHTRGNLFGAMDVADDFNCSLSPKDFPPGILHAVLLTRNNIALSERLIFIPEHETIEVDLKLDSLDYEAWSNLKAQISVKDAQGNPLHGDFAVSVTDDQFVRIDSTENNLLSHFLLQSDLRGNIEAVGSYIHESPSNIDLLMVTHGWTRFNVAELLTTETLQTPEYKIERSQSISGRVVDDFSVPIRNAKLLVCANQIGTWGHGKANEAGLFTIPNLTFPDSTMIILRGTREKGRKAGIKVRLSIHPYSQKKTKWTSPIQWASEIDNKGLNAGFKGRYIIQNGEKIYVFKDFEVRGSKTRIYRDDPRSREERIADYKLDVQSMIKLFPSAAMMNIVERLPFVHVRNGRAYFKGEELGLYINGIESAPEELQFLIKEKVVSIALIINFGPLAMLGYSKPCIAVRTADDYYDFPKEEGLLKTYPLGYLIPDEFFIPKYETKEERMADEEQPRRTLYWNPRIRLEQGTAEFQFPASKGNTSYTIFIEGLSKEGKLFLKKDSVKIR